MIDLEERVAEHFSSLRRIIDLVPRDDVVTLGRLLLQVYDEGKLVVVMGNGGHGATAAHFINDIAKHTVVSDKKNQVVVSSKRFKAITLSDNVALLTAWANDTGYENAFAQQLANWVGMGDLVIAVSGSGNSENIIRAVALANDRGAITIGLTGYKGGRLKHIAQHCIVVPADDDLVIEDMHLCIFHAVTSMVRAVLQGRTNHEPS